VEGGKNGFLTLLDVIFSGIWWLHGVMWSAGKFYCIVNILYLKKNQRVCYEIYFLQFPTNLDFNID